ncbi:hypothetical protein LTR97_005603 [Elasticomyces elasticus]|uniref:Uncharacterized protein n=1 Tax=Elasticomyces elasticus TaxID=574655 RepID=A0AAN7VR38_9PEZI|nr:hypothetical protein LTR97_005603 [Elasticomyces elasticus]
MEITFDFNNKRMFRNPNVFNTRSKTIVVKVGRLKTFGDLLTKFGEAIREFELEELDWFGGRVKLLGGHRATSAWGQR